MRSSGWTIPEAPRRLTDTEQPLLDLVLLDYKMPL
jgi:hypothetical protein